MDATLVIDDLSRQVPEGEMRLFERQISDIEDGFFSVHYNHKYPRELSWHNTLPAQEMPWMGWRNKARIPLSILPPPDVTFEMPAGRMVDFYAHGGSQVFFISDKLRALIEDMDPNSLDGRPITIKAPDSLVDFNVVMPARNLDAIDPARTDILIKDDKAGTHWFRRVQFPNGVVFRDDVLAGVHNFSDRNVQGWFWSRALIDEAKAAGIKGVRTMRAGMVTGRDVDAF